MTHAVDTLNLTSRHEGAQVVQHAIMTRNEVSHTQTLDQEYMNRSKQLPAHYIVHYAVMTS